MQTQYNEAYGHGYNDGFRAAKVEMDVLRQQIATLNAALSTTSEGNFKLRKELDCPACNTRGQLAECQRGVQTVRGEIERLRKELADLEEATTPWRELQDMKKRIDALEPVAWELKTIPPDGYKFTENSTFAWVYKGVPLYDLRGIKE